MREKKSHQIIPIGVSMMVMLALILFAGLARSEAFSVPLTESLRVMNHNTSTPPHTTVAGGLRKKVVLEIINANRQAMDACFATESSERQNLYGKVSIRFTIDHYGRVADASIDEAETTIHDKSLQACMVNSVHAFIFPRPVDGGNVVVTHEWFFKAAP